MADFNPLSFWRRLLALPNESATKTIAIAFVVSAISAVVVSGVAVTLRPLQEANLAADRQARLDAMVASLPAMADVIRASGAQSLETLIVDLRSGRGTDEIAASDLDFRGFAADPKSSTPLSPDIDLAGIGRRPDFARIHVLKTGDDLRFVILPMYAVGYQSTIRAYLALAEGLDTVAALAITEHGETPGLGAKITQPAWLDLWPGKQVADESGAIRLSVARGGATSVYEVDGITGATRTGNAITNMVRFWLGDDGYGPLLRRLREGAL